MTQVLLAIGYTTTIIAFGFVLWALNTAYDLAVNLFDRWCNTPARYPAQRRRRPPTPRKATP